MKKEFHLSSESIIPVKDNVSFSLFCHESYLLKHPNHPQRNGSFEEAATFYKDFPFYEQMIDKKGQKIIIAPVIRLYGNDASGVSVCAHIHGYFPYFYLKITCIKHLIDSNPRFLEEFIEQLETSYYMINSVSEKQRYFLMNTTKVILNYEVVLRTDFYGYHAKPEKFLKIFYYDPKMQRKLVDILQSGVLYGTKFVAYESHLTHFLRFYSDLDICGLSDVNLSAYSIRVQSHEETALLSNKSSDQRLKQSMKYMYNPANKFNSQKRTSTCDLEVDVLYTSVLNYISSQADKAQIDFDHVWKTFERPKKITQTKREYQVEITKTLELIWQEEQDISREAFKSNAPPPKQSILIDYSENIDGLFIEEDPSSLLSSSKNLNKEKAALRSKFNNDMYWINQTIITPGVSNQLKFHLEDYIKNSQIKVEIPYAKTIDQDIQKNFHHLIKSQKIQGEQSMINRNKSYSKRQVHYYQLLKEGKIVELQHEKVTMGEEQCEDQQDMERIEEEVEEEAEEEANSDFDDDEEEVDELDGNNDNEDDDDEQEIEENPKLKQQQMQQHKPIHSHEPEVKKRIKLEYEKELTPRNNIQIWRKNYAATKNNVVSESASILSLCNLCHRFKQFCQCCNQAANQLQQSNLNHKFSLFTPNNHTSTTIISPLQQQQQQQQEQQRLVIQTYTSKRQCPCFNSLKTCKQTSAHEHQYAYYEKFEDLFDHYNIARSIPRTLLYAQILVKSIIKIPTNKQYAVTIKNNLKLPTFYRVYISEEYEDSLISPPNIPSTYTNSSQCPSFKDILIEYEKTTKSNSTSSTTNPTKHQAVGSFQTQGSASHSQFEEENSKNNSNKINNNYKSDITMFTFEVFAKSSPDMVPDPLTDSIQFFVYRIENFLRPSVNSQGVVIVDEMIQFESESGNSSYARKYFGLKEDMFREVFVVKSEEKLLLKLILLVHERNIDIISGYDIEKKSLFYFSHRCWKQNIDIMDILARSPRNFDNIRRLFSLAAKESNPAIHEDHQSGSGMDSCASFKHENIIMQAIKANHRKTRQTGMYANFKLNFSITGRMILNVWRIIKHEEKLRCYELESVVKAFFGKRIPIFSNWNLTKLYNHSDFKQRAYIFQYFMERILYTVQIVEYIKFVDSSASETKLYRFDFPSATSRGHQFRIESIMNRVTDRYKFKLMSASQIGVQTQKMLECSPLTLEPPKLFYPDPVVVLDFQSLYPSLMIAYNLCFTTCLGNIEEKFQAGGRKRVGVQNEWDIDFESLFKFASKSEQTTPQPPATTPQTSGTTPLSLESIMSKIFVAPNKVAFLKKEVREGILPQIVHEFLLTRIHIKHEMKKYAKDPSFKHYYDHLFQRQKSLKLFMVVVFGYTGATYSGRMPLGDLADAIVSTAKFILNQVIHIINNTEKWNAKVIYGDTDSVFVNLKGSTVTEAIRIGKEIESEITRQFPYPVQLKYEKTFREILLVSKKRYVGISQETSAENSAKFEAKGLEVIRRDGCVALQKIMRNCLEVLFTTKNLSGLKAYLNGKWQSLLNGQSIERDFIVARECNLDGYVNTSTMPPHARVATRKLARDKNTKPKHGERIKFLVVKKAESQKLSDTSVSIEEYMHAHRNELNWNEYITKFINPPLFRAFTALDIDINDWFAGCRKTDVRVNENPLHGFGSRIQGKLKNSTTSACSRNAGLDAYYVKQICIVCSKKSEQSVCSKCCSDPVALRMILASKRAAVQNKLTKINESCMRCSSTNSDFDEPLACQQYDCEDFFGRAKAKDHSEIMIPTLNQYISHIDRILDQAMFE